MRQQSRIGNWLVSVFWAWIVFSEGAYSVKSAEDPASAPTQIRGFLGLLLAEESGYPVIRDILQGSPAAKSGDLTNGLAIVAITLDGTNGTFIDTRGLPLEKIQQLLASPPGTTVTIKVLPPPFLATVTARVVELEVAMLPLSSGKTFRGTESFTYTNFGTTSVLSEVISKEVWPLRTNYIQPDYDAWQRLHVGMRGVEVLDLLGPPLRQRGFQSAVHIWDYGYVSLASPCNPVDLTFSIWLQESNVLQIADPFGGLFSSNGLPTIPTLIYPRGGQSFQHYPRLLDLRWQPASGWYPMNYNIELDIKLASGWSAQTFSTTEPHLAVAFPGANGGRWRVRGVNKLGQSGWSEFGYFEFRQ